jgi:plastocyanin
MKKSLLVSSIILMGILTQLPASMKVEVEIEDFAFVPQTVTIKVGDTVEWKNRDAVGHTSTSGTPGMPDGIWDSGLLGEDDRFSFVFEGEGTYPYYCRLHTSMSGTVIVEPRDTTPAVDERPEFLYFDLKVGHAGIHFSLPGPSHAEIAIYDLAGNRIEILASGAYNSGDHRVSRPLLNPGIYFVRLVSRYGILTRKLVQPR